MTEQLNIISICCNVSLPSMNDASRTISEQIIFKNHISHVFNLAFKYIGQTNRMILITDNGAEIAYTGTPEDAMLIARDILNSILMSNKPVATPFSVRIGIHLQPVSAVDGINAQSNIIADSINAARRVMSHAKPNEILVSRAYYENTPSSTQAVSTLLDDLGSKHDNHVIDYQAYLTGLMQEQASENQLPILKRALNLDDLKLHESSDNLNAGSWRYALASLFILIALFATIKLIITPSETSNKIAKKLPIKDSQSTNLNTLSVKPDTAIRKADVDGEGDAFMQEKLEPSDSLNAKPAKKEVKQKTKSRVDPTEKKSKSNEIISWEILKNSIKQGQKHECTQAEIAMNQCR